jgi:hypothetical protein
MADDDVLAPLARWLIDRRSAIDIEGKIAITKKASPEGELTIIMIDHLVSCQLPGRDGWRVTTKRTYLPPRHFHSSAAHTLKSADHDRGRTIYCMDHGFNDEVVAALSYHLDKRGSWPLFITAIGFRIDFPDNAVLRQRTLEAAFLLKQYAHAIAALTERGGDVHAEVPPNSVTRYAEELGFRNAKRPKGLRSSGTHLRQAPLGG